MTDDTRPDKAEEPWETAMTNEFDRRVRDLNEAPLTLDQVKGTAVTIKHKRRAVVAGGLLAAAAVIAPIAVLALSGDDQTRTIQPAPDPTPSVATDSADPTPTPTPTEVVPSAANPLVVAYLQGTTLIRGDGSTVDLPRPYSDGTPLGDDLFLGAFFETPNSGDTSITVDVVDSSGSVISSEAAGSFPVSNDEHTVGAYLNADGGVELRSANDQATVPTTFADGDTPVTIVGDSTCIEDEDCVVVVESGSKTSARAVSMDGAAQVLTNGIQILNDAEGDGLTVGSISISDEGTCNSVISGPTQEQRFENCEFRYFSFSPNTTYLSGAQSYADGFGDAWAGIYSAEDGTEIARFTPESGAVTSSSWRDEENLLVTTYDYDLGAWSVVNLSFDGTTTTLLGPTEAPDFEPPYVVVGGQ